MTENRTTWGAYKSEWNKFIELGLYRDLLPVVSNPGAEVSKNSKMRDLGKTPSMYNQAGYASGIAAWPEKETSMQDIANWSKQQDYGICLQTRLVRALDIDIPDPTMAIEIENFIYDFIGDKLPLRFRTNSGKRLLAFKLPGELTKRVLKTNGGIIEFLANGQQFIAAGQHPTGARYEWNWFDFINFPEMDLEVFENLWFALSEAFGIAPSKTRGVRNKGEGEAILDETLDFLVEKGLVIDYGMEGQAFIECPFSEDHTTESSYSATAYFPKGSRGYQQGHFVCLHAHCEDRKDNDFLNKLGVFEAEMDTIVVTPEEKALELPAFQRDKNGSPVGNIDNVCLALDRVDIGGAIPCYDVFRDEIIFFNKDRTKWERASDGYYVRLRRLLEKKYRFLPIGRELIRDAVLLVAEQNKIDTAQMWLDGLEWDGVPRIDNFLHNYFGAQDTEYTRAVSMYLWTGLAGRIIEPGLKADMVVIAAGEQGLMKSTVISAIAPTLDEFCEIDLSDKDDDMARKMRGILIAEISELRGMRTRAIESIKSFTARTHEKWIPKYREFSTSFPRRLMFIGTTNDAEFLADITGNRRWLPFNVTGKANVAMIVRDRNQLWAEAAEMFKLAGLFFEKAEKLAVQEHEKFTIHDDSWFSVLNDWLNTEDLDGNLIADREFLRTVDILREAFNMDIKNIKRADEMKVADVMKKLGYHQERRKVGGSRERRWTKV